MNDRMLFALLAIFAVTGIFAGALTGAAIVTDKATVTGTVVETSRAISENQSAAPVEYSWNGATRQGYVDGLYNIGDTVTVYVQPDTGQWYMGETSKIGPSILGGMSGLLTGLLLGMAFLAGGSKLAQVRKNRRRLTRRAAENALHYAEG